MKRSRKAQITFNRIFQNQPPKKGDFIRFVQGKIVWKVSTVYRDGELRLNSCKNVYVAKTLYKNEHDRVYRITKEEAIAYVATNSPYYLNRFFKSYQLEPFFRKVFKKVDIREL